jgi:hypothetical protein
VLVNPFGAMLGAMLNRRVVMLSQFSGLVRYRFRNLTGRRLQ